MTDAKTKVRGLIEELHVAIEGLIEEAKQERIAPLLAALGVGHPAKARKPAAPQKAPEPAKAKKIIKRRRQYTADFKKKTVALITSGEMTAVQVSKRDKIPETTISNWLGRDKPTVA